MDDLPGCRTRCETCWSQLAYLESFADGEITTKEQALRKFDKVLTKKEVIQNVNSLKTTLFSTKTELADLIKDYGDVIMRRWNKRNVRERTQLLLSIKPFLHSEKWEMSLFANVAPPSEDKDACDEVSLLQGYKLEDLAQDPSRLVKAVFLRTSHTPADFIRFDTLDIRFALPVTNLRKYFGPGSIILADDKFGTWTEWDSSQIHAMYSTSVPQALLLLTTQVKVMGFLLNVGQKLLLSKPEPSGDGNLLTACTEPYFPYPPKSDKFHLSSTDKYYISPGFRLHEFDSLVDKWRLSAREMNERLHNDPDYSLEYLRMSQTRALNRHLSVEKTKLLTAHGLFTWPTINLIWWDLIHKAVQRVKQMQMSYRSHLNHPTKLPCEYEAALRALYSLLGMFVHICNDVLRRIKGDYTKVADKFSGNVKDSAWTQLYREDRCAWCMTILQLKATKVSLYSATALRVLDRLIKSDSKILKRFDKLTRNVLSSLGMCWHLRFNLLQHAPSFDTHECETEDDRVKRVGKVRTHFWVFCMAVLTDPTLKQDTFLYEKLWESDNLAPPSRKKDNEWFLKQKERAANCTSAWNTYTQGLYNIWNFEFTNPVMVKIEYPNRDLVYEEVISLFSPWTPSRTSIISSPSTSASRVAFLKKCKLAVLSQQQPKDEKVDAVTEEYQDAFKDDGRSPSITQEVKLEAQVKLAKQQARAKNKSVPSEAQFPSLQAMNSTLPETDSEQTTKKPTFTLSRKRYRQIRSIFPRSATSSSEVQQTLANEHHRHHLHWQDFLNLMADLGCEIDNGSGGTGSAVAFILKGKGRFVAHKPHPVAKLQEHHLRNIEAGLRTAFGWSSEDFGEVSNTAE